MKTLLATLLLTAAPGVAAEAACFAEYKAKQDRPLQLHYGIMQVGDGDCPAPGEAEQEIAARLASGGWTLLAVTGLSTAEPSAQQKANAGAYYLRF